VTQVNEQGDEYVVVWEDGKKRDTQKASWHSSQSNSKSAARKAGCAYRHKEYRGRGVFDV
jgi:hypothetical protein